MDHNHVLQPAEQARFFAALSRALHPDRPLPEALLTAVSEAQLPEAYLGLAAETSRLGSLGPAMEQSGLFTPAQCTLVGLTEGTERLSALCLELEADCKKEERLRQEIHKTAQEVARWGLLLLGVFILLMGVVLPLGIEALDDLALSLGKARPLLPRLIGSGGLGLAAAALFCLGGFLLLFYSRQRSLALEWLSRLFQDFRNLSMQVNAARFFQGLALGRAGGLSLRESVYLAAAGVGDTRYQERLARAVELLEGGLSFADAAGDAGLLPRKQQAALDRGEGAEALAEEAFEGALSGVPALGARMERRLMAGICGFLALGVFASLISLIVLL